MKKRKPLGDILIKNGIITEAQLKSAIGNQEKLGGKLGESLIQLGLITHTQLAQCLSEQLELPFIDLQHFEFKPDVTMLLPEMYARRFHAMLLKEENGKLLLAMSDPSDIYAYDEISRIVQKPIQLGVVVDTHLMDSIDLVYRHREEISGFAEKLSEEVKARGVDLGELKVDTGVEDAPVVRLLQSLFTDAVHMNASDIHLEPDESVLRIRQRIDGELQETILQEKKITNPLILRLKLMAGLNIAEKRLPQDGRFNIRVRGENIDVRLSTMPVQYGESVVMRLLNQSQDKLNLEQLGVTKKMKNTLWQLVNRSHGMVLVTGPTGSGKTTTLYSVLGEINVPEKKIITVEDPIEYHLPRINQVQINEQVGLTFTRVLHSALRHDPDIMLIGEIRDEETATIALRAAMTGHLVLATLHTNDAASSALRLISMGVDSFLVASALTAILAQRLVKRICNRCMSDYSPTKPEIEWLKLIIGEEYALSGLKEGRGCSYCNNTGYKGRIGVFELLEMNKDMVRALNRNDHGAYFTAVENNEQYLPLGLAAIDLVKQGITTISEAYRIMGQITDELSMGIKEMPK